MEDKSLDNKCFDISKQLNKIIIPFIFGNGDGNNSIEELNNVNTIIQNFKNDENWEKISLNKNELYDHITDIIGSKNEYQNLGTMYKLDEKGKKLYDFTGKFCFSVKNKIKYFKYINVYLCLFKMKIGFLIFDIDYTIDSNEKYQIDTIEIGNYYLKKLKQTIIYKSEGKYSYSKDIKSENQSYSEEKLLQLNKITVEYSQDNKQFINLITDINKKENFQIINEKRKLKSKQEYFSLNNTIRPIDHIDIVRKFNFNDKIIEMLENCKVETFFYDLILNKNGNKVLYPEKAIVYNVAIIEGLRGGVQEDVNDFENILNNYLFRMRRSFKESYIPSKAELKIDANEEVQRIFDNSFWGVAREGCTNIAYLTGGAGDSFLTGNYISRTKDTYFYLYLIVLQQYYGLLYFGREISKLPGTIDKYGRQEIERIKKLKDQMQFFYLKCMFNEVSNITHQTKVYHAMRKVLGIENLISELFYEINTISSIINTEIDNRREKRTKILSVIGAAFVFISTVSSVWQISSGFINKDYTKDIILSIPNLSFILTFVAIISVPCILGVLGYLLLKNKS